MVHLRKINTVLALCAVATLASAGLPAAPVSARAPGSGTGIRAGAALAPTAGLGAPLPAALASGPRASGLVGRDPFTADVETDASGCPTVLGTISPGEHCVSWPVSLFPQMSGSDKGCAEALFMLMPLHVGVDEYVAVWSWDTPAARAHPWTFTAAGGPHGSGSGPYGEEQWSTTALTPQNTGVNVHYDVPTGSGAWFVAAGGGPGPCEAKTGSAEGWVVTYRWEVGGRVTFAGTDDPVPGVTVQADCPSGGTTTTNSGGYYNFLLAKGPCTITPEAPDGQTVEPKKQAVDVEGNMHHVDFQVTGILYFKVQKGVSVTTQTGSGPTLVKAGTAFTEQVVLKDLSKTKSVLVAPIYPDLSGNAEGGALQPVGGVVQKQLSSMAAAEPSPIVVLRPGEEQDFDSVVETVASRSLGTGDGGYKASGGTRAYVQFSAPSAFVLHDDETLTPLDARQIEVANGSTDKIAVSIDDSAADRTSINGYNAVADISVGIGTGIVHATWGLVSQVWDNLQLPGKTLAAVPTAFINYVDMESQLWQEAKGDRAEMALLLDNVTNTMLLIYKQAPFLLKKVGDIKDGVNGAVYQHFNKLDQEWLSGDWEDAFTGWATDFGELAGNSLSFYLTPERLAGAIGDVAIVRTPGLVPALEKADTDAIAADAKQVAADIGTGEQADDLPRAVQAMKDLKPGVTLGLTEAANLFGLSVDNLTDLINFCKQNRVVVTLRSRASEAIQLLEEGLSVVKPAAIKLKTVSQIDLDWLGFPRTVVLDGQSVDSFGQVLIRDPVYLSAECALDCALGKLQDEMRAKELTPDDPEWVEVQSRWVQRYDEWVSNENGYIPELEHQAKKGQLTLDWHWGENKINPAKAKPAQTVGFRIVPDPGSSDIKIPQICDGKWSPATRVCSGKWKSITGDIDLVSIENSDMSPLSDPFYIKMLQDLGATSVATQHPATATWYKTLNDDSILFDANRADFAEKAKYMGADKCCLLQVGADGVPRAVMLDLKGSWFTNKNDFYLNYIGRELVPAPGTGAPSL